MTEDESRTSRSGDDIETALVGRVAKGGTLGFLGRLASKGLSFVLQAALTRVLGPSAYGRYVLGLSVAKVAQQVGQVGLNEGVIRFASIHRDRDERLAAVLKDSIGAATIASLLVAGIVFLGAKPIALAGFHDPRMVWVLRAFAPAIPLYVLLEVTTAHFQAFERIGVQQALKSGIRPVLNLVLVVTAFAVGYRLDGAIGAFVLTGGLTAFVGGVYLFGRTGLGVLLEQGAWGDEIRGLLRFSLPMLIITMSFTLAMRTDRFMLGFFRTAEVVGIYNVAAMIAQQFSIVVAALISIFKPMIAAAHDDGNSARIQGLYHIVTRWAAFGTLGLFVGVGALGRPLLSVFGPSFLEALPILAVLPLVYVTGSLFGPCAALLRMTGRVKLEVLNATVLVVLNVIFNLLFIPRFGALGAAIGVLAAGVSTNLLQVGAVYVIYGFHPFDREHVILIGFVSIASAISIHALLGLTGVARLLVASAVGIAAVTLFVLTMRDVERSVLRSVLEQ